MNGKRFGYLLVGLVLMVEVPRFYGTYATLDPMLFGVPFTAIGTGIALPLGAGFVFHAWWTASKRGRKGHNWLLAAFIVLLALEGTILIPWGMSRLQGDPLAAVVGSGLLAWGWIAVVMLSPFAVVGAVVMAVAFQPSHRKAEARPSEPKAERPELEAEQPEIDGTARAILETWRADPSLSLERVGRAAGIAKSTVARRRDALERKGLLARTDDGVEVRWNGGGGR